MLSAEIFCLGNELLIGRTVNTNATDIAFAVSKIGYSVERVTTVRDNLNSAIQAFQEILQRKPNVICVSGGLGPTFDDIQVEVISTAMDKKLVLHSEALQMIAKRYKVPIENLPETGRKMSMLPTGSVALKNSVGAAPGIRIQYEGSIIFSLPGVPKEMQAILYEEVIPYLKSQNNDKQRMIEFGFSLRGVGESRIVELSEQVMKKFPHVNFKSHPRKDETGYWLSLQTYLITDNEESVKKACEEWRLVLQSNFDVVVSDIKPVFDEKFVPD
ncbi:MAG: competence/damage-inducible protein A [Candidatus Kariarchaeaceae archaeon]|jgi:molybdenum cofactor synthesis domain-containing protein